MDHRTIIVLRMNNIDKSLLVIEYLSSTAILIVSLFTMEMSQTYEFKGGIVRKLDASTLLVCYNKGAVLGVEDAEAVRDIRLKLIGATEFYNVMDMTEGFLKISAEAKAWMAVNQTSSTYRKADIIVVKSFFSKLKILAYLLLYKPTVKTYAVTSTDKAIELIKDLKNRKIKNVHVMA